MTSLGTMQLYDNATDGELNSPQWAAILNKYNAFLALSPVIVGTEKKNSMVLKWHDWFTIWMAKLKFYAV